MVGFVDKPLNDRPSSLIQRLLQGPLVAEHVRKRKLKGIWTMHNVVHECLQENVFRKEAPVSSHADLLFLQQQPSKQMIQEGEACYMLS